MSSIALITDSTADISATEREALGVFVVPLNIHFGDEVLRDTVDISASAFLQRLETATVMPHTSQPSPEAFKTAIEELAREHDAVVILTIASKLSGTYQSAVIGSKYADTTVPIKIVDSRSASIGLGMQVRRARTLINGGSSLNELVETLERERDRYQLLFFADTLEYLQRGGRIGKASHLVGSLLKIKPLLRCQFGEVVPFERTRSRARAIDGLIDFARQCATIDAIAILHDGTTPNDVDTLLHGITDRIPATSVIVDTYGPIIATHVGPRALGICVFGTSE